jgi:hypothetical protein
MWWSWNERPCPIGLQSIKLILHRCVPGRVT